VITDYGKYISIFNSFSGEMIYSAYNLGQFSADYEDFESITKAIKKQTKKQKK